MKLREYLAMGKKVACNDVGEMRLFRTLTYQSSSCIDDFADAICTALTKGDGRECNGPEFIRDRFNWDVIGRDFFQKIREEFGV